MPLSPHDMLQIKQLVADPIAQANREANERIEKMLSDHVVEHDAKLRNHEERLAALEAVKKKAIFVWSMIIFAVTGALGLLWSEVIKPFVLRWRAH